MLDCRPAGGKRKNKPTGITYMCNPTGKAAYCYLGRDQKLQSYTLRISRKNVDFGANIGHKWELLNIGKLLSLTEPQFIHL